MDIQNIVIIGAGNVATHLAEEFHSKGIKIQQIFSRTAESADILASKVGAEPVIAISKINQNADFYLISISDSAINDFVHQLNFKPSIIAHTAGSISIDALNKFKNYGVFYPLQTFSKKRNIDFSNLPVCLEASSESNLNSLTVLAKKITSNVWFLTSEQRKQAHLAAVFANNFTNHMYAVARQVLAEQNLEFDLLKPLILETAQKVQSLAPEDAQTGPAVRADRNVINNHLKQLSSPKLEKIYSFVSDSIMEMHK